MHPNRRLTWLSLALSVLAPLVVAASLAGSGRYVALGAYVSLIAFGVSVWSYFVRRNRSSQVRIAAVLSGITLLIALFTLAVAIGLMGPATLWFDGSG